MLKSVRHRRAKSAGRQRVGPTQLKSKILDSPLATFSEVQPMGCCVSRATGWASTSSAKLSAPRSGLLSPKTQRRQCSLSFDRTEVKRTETHVADMDSNPTASPTSISPLRIWFEIAETAIKPEEQKLRGRDKRCRQ